jgi:hypothetical protein
MRERDVFITHLSFFSSLSKKHFFSLVCLFTLSFPLSLFLSLSLSLSLKKESRRATTTLVKQNRNEYYLLLIRAKKERKTKEQKENGKLSADETPDSRARLEGDDSFRHRVFLFRHDGELYCDALSLEISIHIIIIIIIICFIGAEP